MSKTNLPAVLTIKNAQFYGYHGVKTEENTLGGRYQIDAELTYNDTAAVVSDDVKNALNYDEVMFAVDEVINGDPLNLIETVAYEILTALMDRFPQILRATIRVRKLSVPIRHVLDYVQVEKTMTRE